MLETKFPVRQLGDFVKVRSGYAFSSNDFGSFGVPVIKIKNVQPPSVETNDVKYIPEEIAAGIKGIERFEIEQGDILIAMTGATVGKIGRMPSTGHRYLLNQRVGKVYLRSNAEADYTYLYYVLSNEKYVRQIFNLADGSAQANISGGQIEGMQIPTPPFPEQRAIASVLGSLDDKIELNRRMNRTLEQMAAAVFKAWFVDFEPVRAKAGGADAFAGMPQDVFDSHPATFVDSELGPIPEGWEVKLLPDIIEVNPKRILKKDNLASHLEMKNMPTQGHAPMAWGVRSFGSGMKFINGDTLVARITPCLENGKTAFVDFLDDGTVGWGSTEYIVLRPKSPLPKVFAYCLARTDDFRDFAIQNMTGTSGRQRVPAAALDHYPLVLPDETTARCFGEIVDPLFTMIRSNMDESRSLAETRDALLPKLLSGEVRVRDLAAKGLVS